MSYVCGSCIWLEQLEELREAMQELFNTPLKQPAIMVFGKQDEFYDYGKNSQARADCAACKSA